MRITLGNDLPLQGVSRAYIKVGYFILALIAIVTVVFPLIAAILVPLWFDSRLWPIVLCAVAIIGVVCVLISATIISRRIRALGYAELEEELAIRSGIMFQKLVLVPYGRLQQVNVETGPLLSRWGLAKIEIVTASADTNARIPGLALHEAERLRESLISRARAHMEGL